jgi:CHAT domain-containing protein
VRPQCLDRVISSYTPTIRALSYARQGSRSRTTVNRALIVAMPDTPGAEALPAVEQEVRRLTSLLPEATLLEGRHATCGAVLDALPLHSIAHFSCHGDSGLAENDPADPSQSQLLLHDHASVPFTVARLASVNLDHAQLAYLSACDTTVTRSIELLDQAIHLTAAFQLAGFPHVIGTLWRIGDESAVTIASDFYTGLHTSQGTLDTNQAAYALHHALRAARDKYPTSPSHWAAYLHAGA